MDLDTGGRSKYGASLEDGVGMDKLGGWSRVELDTGGWRRLELDIGGWSRFGASQ